MARPRDWPLYADHQDPEDVSTWTRPTKRALCTGCNRAFSEDRHFDAHRVEIEDADDPPEYRCMTDAELRKVGLRKGDDRIWAEPYEVGNVKVWRLPP